jgi:catechol 2,3-dioxygenase-like lactoylglutathione lyase family enzyme
MIQRLSHCLLYVLDQEAAHDFYVNKLGFEVRTDNNMQGFRWLTVGPKGQPDLELVLMPIMPNPMMDEATANTLRDVVKKGLLGAGIWQTADCQKTYEELTAKGVEFMQPPTERFYGTEAVFKDNSGNWLSLSQPKPWA